MIHVTMILVFRIYKKQTLFSLDIRPTLVNDVSVLAIMMSLVFSCMAFWTISLFIIDYCFNVVILMIFA